MVSAFAARQRLVLAQTRVGEKANEIVVIPALLADRWGGRHHRRDGMPARDCEQDHRQEGHYILALKGNQGRLREDVELFANEQKAKGFPDTTVSGDETVDGDHGRIETRRVTVVHDVRLAQESARLARTHTKARRARLGLVIPESAWF